MIINNTKKNRIKPNQVIKIKTSIKLSYNNYEYIIVTR